MGGLPALRMGNICGGSRETGQGMHWTITKNIDKFQAKPTRSTETVFRECRPALAAIRGKSVFGIYHSTEGTLFYASWDDEASEKAAIPALCQAFSQEGAAFTESDWTDNTVGYKGKLWSTPSEVLRPN